VALRGWQAYVQQQLHWYSTACLPASVDASATVFDTSIAAAAAADAWQGALSELLSGGDFEAKQSSASRALRLGKAAAAAAGPRYVALLGLGKAEGLAKPAGERYGANPYQVCARA
jgi:hypothetical protein